MVGVVATMGLVLAACGGSSDADADRNAADTTPTNGVIGMRIVNESGTAISGLSQLSVEPGWSNAGTPSRITVDGQSADTITVPAGGVTEFTVPAVLGTGGGVAPGNVVAVFDVEGGGTVTLTGTTNPSGVTQGTCSAEGTSVACGQSDIVFDIDGAWGFASFSFTLN